MILSNWESNLAQHLNLQLKPPQGPPHNGSNVGLDQANPHTWRFAQKGMSYPISIFFPFFYFFLFHLFLLILFKFYRNSTLQDYSKCCNYPKKCKKWESFGLLQLPKKNAKKGKALECYNFQKTMQRKGRFWNVATTKKKMKRKGKGIIS